MMTDNKNKNSIYNPNVQYLQRNKKIKNNDTTIVQKEQKEIIYLTDDEKTKFNCKGFISGFQKQELIGKGGFALVWLASCNNKKYAVKQQIRNQNE